MSDQLSIYLIIALNVLVQLMLMGRLNFPDGGKRKYQLLALAIPLLIILTMRLLVLAGIVQGRVSDQSGFERLATTGASILLLGGPCLVTIAAIFDKRRKGWVIKRRRGSPGPE